MASRIDAQVATASVRLTKRREYNIIVSEHSNNLYGYAIRFLRNREDASDIVQDVFEKLWIHRKNVEFAKAKSWMFTTAHNAMINFSSYIAVFLGIHMTRALVLPMVRFLEPQTVKRIKQFFKSLRNCSCLK